MLLRWKSEKSFVHLTPFILEFSGETNQSNRSSVKAVFFTLFLFHSSSHPRVAKLVSFNGQGDDRFDR